MKEYEGQTVDEPYISQTEYIERVCQISNIKRIGWNIDKKVTLQPKSRQKIVNSKAAR